MFFRQRSNTIIYGGSEPYIRNFKGVSIYRYFGSAPLRRVTYFMIFMPNLIENIKFYRVFLAVQKRRYLRHFGSIAKMSKKHMQL